MSLRKSTILESCGSSTEVELSSGVIFLMKPSGQVLCYQFFPNAKAPKHNCCHFKNAVHVQLFRAGALGSVRTSNVAIRVGGERSGLQQLKCFTVLFHNNCGLMLYMTPELLLGQARVREIMLQNFTVCFPC
jgi:hypothetical protein